MRRIEHALPRDVQSRGGRNLVSLEAPGYDRLAMRLAPLATFGLFLSIGCSPKHEPLKLEAAPRLESFGKQRVSVLLPVGTTRSQSTGHYITFSAPHATTIQIAAVDDADDADGAIAGLTSTATVAGAQWKETRREQSGARLEVTLVEISRRRGVMTASWQPFPARSKTVKTGLHCYALYTMSPVDIEPGNAEVAVLEKVCRSVRPTP